MFQVLILFIITYVFMSQHNLTSKPNFKILKTLHAF